MSRLNADYVVRRIDELGLRRWWIAEQTGVDRRTLHRWLAGKTGRIPGEKLRELARMLDTDVADLLLVSEPLLATPSDQVRAAKSLLDSQLLETVMPSHQFALFEQLAKGLVVPGLSDGDLGQLYMALALALFRQSKLNDAFHYAALARQIADTTADRPLQLRADMQLAFREYVRGNYERAIERDEANLRLSQALEDTRLTAACLSNLGDQYREFGWFERSEACQREAIRLYEQEQIPASLVFCHLGLVMLGQDRQDYEMAQYHLRVARDIAADADFQRGLADCDLFESVTLAETGQSNMAMARLTAALDGYQRLNIREPRTHAMAARVYRLAGRRRDARQSLQRGLDLVQEKDAPGLARELIAERRRLVP